jgi:hypothetical protein
MMTTAPKCQDRDNHRAGEIGCPSVVLDCQGIPVDGDALDTAPVPAPRTGEPGVYSVVRTASGCLARVAQVDRVPFYGESDRHGHGIRRPFGVWDFNTEEAGRVLVVTYESRGPLDRDARHYAAVFVGGDLVDGAGALDMARGPAALGAEIAWRAARHIADRPAPAQVAEAPAVDVDQVAEAEAPAPADDPANYLPHWSQIPQVVTLPADWTGEAAKWTPGKDVARMVRDAVKAAFPGVKFSVRTDACTLHVSWTDGPLCDAVDLVVKPYAGQTFDGMTDSRSSVGDVLVIGRGGTRTPVNLGTDFVFTSRQSSADLVESMRPTAAVMAGRELSADPSADWFPGDLGDTFGVWHGMGNGRELLDFLSRTRTPDMRGHNDQRPACGAPGAFGRTCELAAGHPYPFVHRDSYGRPFIGRPADAPAQVATEAPAPVAQVDAPAEAPAAGTRGFFDQRGNWIPQGSALSVAPAPAAEAPHRDAATMHADVIAYRRRVDAADAPAQVAEAPAGPLVESVDAVKVGPGVTVISGFTLGVITRADRQNRAEGWQIASGGAYTRFSSAWQVKAAVVGANVCRTAAGAGCSCPLMHTDGRALATLPRVAEAPAGADADPDPATDAADAPEVAEVERWSVLGHVTSHGSDARGRMFRAMRRVHGLPDCDPAAALADGPALIAERDADPRTWAQKCAAYLAAYAVLMTEDGAGKTHRVEPEPADRPAPAPVPADAPAGPVAVADLVAGDRVHVVGIDQFGSPSHAAGFVQSPPSEVSVKGRTPSGRVSKDPKKARPGLLVSLAETPNGWNGWRMTIVATPDAVAERVSDAAHQYRPAPADLPHLVKPACSCGGLEYAGTCRPDAARVVWGRHVAPPAGKPQQHTPAMLAQAEALGGQGYAEGWPSAPGACGEIVDMVRGWEIGTGAAEVFRAFSRGYSAAADRAAAEALARIDGAAELAAGTAAIAERNPAAAPMAELHAEQRDMTAREAGARVADAETARAELAQVADDAAGAPAEAVAEAPAVAGEADDQGDAPDVYTLPLEAYTPVLDSDPDGDLLITHDHESGTTLDGSRRGDGVWEIVKAHRFECRRGVIFIRHSRDRFADLRTIDNAAKALRAAGHTVTVEIDDVWRPAAVREEARAERASARAERLSDRAVRQYGEANSRREASRRIGDMMPFGEPIKIGHHSERAHRRAFERMETNTRASIAAWDYAQHLDNRAAGAEANEAAKHGPRAIMRRIERIEAEGRQWARSLAEAIEGSAAGYARRAMLEAEKIAEDIAYQRAKLGDMAAAGAFVAWSRESVQRGDLVKVGGRWCEVARVNQKGVSVYARFEWSGSDRAQPVTWDGIFGRRRDGLQWDAPNAEPRTIEEASRVARWRNLVSVAACTSYDRNNEEEERQRRNTARARRLVLGLNYDATPQEVEAYGEPADEQGKRARALACLAVFERLEAGEHLADVARSLEPIGDTVPVWTMPAAAPVEVRARDLVPGDIVAGVYDDFFGKRRLVRSIVGPVTAPTTERDRHESGDYAYLTVSGEMHEMKAWRSVAAHLVGARPAPVAQ